MLSSCMFVAEATAADMLRIPFGAMMDALCDIEIYYTV